MSGNEKFSVTLTDLHHTPNAILVESGTSEDAWLPFSVIDVQDNIDTLDRHDDVTADVTGWLLEKYGLDDLTEE